MTKIRRDRPRRRGRRLQARGLALALAALGPAAGACRSPSSTSSPATAVASREAREIASRGAREIASREARGIASREARELASREAREIASREAPRMSVGEVEITLLVDASIRLRYRDLNVFIDPYAADDLTAEDFAELGPADLIFLTHEDSGHFAPATITALTGERTLVLAPLFPAWILAFLADRIRVVSLREGDHRQLRGIGVDVLPMHNIVHEQEVGGPRHREGQGVGYLLTLGEARIYVSGDTECAPAIQALEDVDVAFLSVNEESMWPSEAAACVAAFRPKIVVPYHIRGVDLGALTQAFADALADATGIELRVLDPGGTGADASDL